MFNFVRVGAATPKISVADCTYNGQEIIKCILDAVDIDIQVLTFPESCITAHTCGDLFHQATLVRAAEKTLEKIAEATENNDIVVIVGLPIPLDNQLFNCATLVQGGKIKGLVPKTYLPNYGEFYEKRWFASADDLISDELLLCEQKVPIGSDLLFTAKNMPLLKIGIEICEDLWCPIPPSSYQSLFGATLICNLSAGNEIAAKQNYRKSLVSQQSSRCIAAYVYASAGIGESTQDMVFSGHSLIYENGNQLAESKRFEKNSQIIYADIDIEQLASDRQKNSSFMGHLNKPDAQRFYREIKISIAERPAPQKLQRSINPHPFIPSNTEDLNSRCADIFQIQCTGLARRMEHTHSNSLVVGISGGLDSTLALLVAVKACDFLEIDRSHVLGITMPGFGTTDRTYQNALTLMKELGITMREISIKEASLQHFKDIGHDPAIRNTAYENTQARERTQILMDIANIENGLVVGTGDLSELALGFATYNGDHMSMYGVNAGIPKTLVQVLVKWVADHGDAGETASKVLLDVLDTPVSPELLPPDDDGNIHQKTEEIVGPYELHDFFLYYVIRFGFTPTKIYYLAKQAFGDKYSNEILLKWLKNFYRRFFTQQFKRSCLPDGPKVGAINLSPRGDWRMPTDASSRIWLDEATALEDKVKRLKD